jgi:hypothetical protein
MDDVVLPLILAAEEDVGAGRAALGLARAELALATVGPNSAIRVRAEGVRLVAMQRLEGATADPPPAEQVVEPLLRAAELDIQNGRHALAVARVELVLARVPEDSPVATSARAFRSVAAQLVGTSAGSVPVASSPSAGSDPRTLSSGWGREPASAASTSLGAYEAPVPRTDSELAASEPRGHGALRRGDGEVVELYIDAALYGGYVGFWFPFVAGLGSRDRRTGSSDASGAQLGYSLSVLAGGSLLILGAALLDQGDGLRTGIAPAISTGIRYGVLAGFLMWGALDRSLSPVRDPVTFEENRGGLAERTGMPVLFGLGGLLTGAAVGYGLLPGISEVRFVETSAIWGTGIGFFLAIAAARDAAEAFGITAAGLATGLLTSAVLCGTGLRISPARSWLMTLGFVVGIGVGTLVPALASAGSGQFDVRVFGAVAVATSIAGLIVSGIVTEGMDAEGPDARSQIQPDVQIGFGPTEGGGIVTFRGTF